MKFNEPQWHSMKINDSQWKSMTINANQWTLMKINEHQWESLTSMKIHEHPWINQMNPASSHIFIWTLMKFIGSSEFSWNAMNSNEIHWFSWIPTKSIEVLEYQLDPRMQIPQWKSLLAIRKSRVRCPAAESVCCSSWALSLVYGNRATHLTTLCVWIFCQKIYCSMKGLCGGFLFDITARQCLTLPASSLLATSAGFTPTGHMPCRFGNLATLKDKR